MSEKKKIFWLTTDGHHGGSTDDPNYKYYPKIKEDIDTKGFYINGSTLEFHLPDDFAKAIFIFVDRIKQEAAAGTEDRISQKFSKFISDTN